LLALSERRGVTQKGCAFSVVHDLDVQEAWRIERSRQVKCSPDGRLVGVDLSEVTAGMLGSGLHEATGPALADTHAYVTHPFRNALDQAVFCTFTQSRDAGADVYQVRILAGFQERLGKIQCVT